MFVKVRYSLTRITSQYQLSVPVPAPVVNVSSYRTTRNSFVFNVNMILAVINAAYAVAKGKPEKIRLAGIRTLTSAIPVQRSNQLS